MIDSLNASLTKGPRFCAPKIFSWLVSFSVKRTAGKSPSGPASANRLKRPKVSWFAANETNFEPPGERSELKGEIRGLGPHSSSAQSQLQVLRNQRVGKICRAAASGPRFARVIRIRMSFGEALAYSAKTS